MILISAGLLAKQTYPTRNRRYAPFDVIRSATDSPTSQSPVGPPASSGTATTSVPRDISTASGWQGFAPTAGQLQFPSETFSTPSTLLRAATRPQSDEASAMLLHGKLEEQNRQYGAIGAKLRSELNETRIAAAVLGTKLTGYVNGELLCSMPLMARSVKFPSGRLRAHYSRVNTKANCSGRFACATIARATGSGHINCIAVSKSPGYCKHLHRATA